ncbi:MAG: FAD-dependent thymidylate synthase [Candidatus Odinarchaeia archaeon]
MEVELISYTPNPDKLVYLAAKTCYAKTPPLEIMEKEITEKEKKLIRKIIKSGHTSVIEHVKFTFVISGISRSCSHQLVRHRIASYSQQSQRYVKYESEDTYVIPPSIKKNRQALTKYVELTEKIGETYKDLRKIGIPKEDSRFILPNAVKTNIVVSMNARALWNFFNLRCCVKSQWEIRELAWTMLKKVKNVAPLLFENAGPWCFSGVCPEGDEICRRKMLMKLKEVK